ncbi:hypothetical protein A2U01_0100342, partial [Trifolium medium]|nr:hypothetical protein [Trifolium medium]
VQLQVQILHYSKQIPPLEQYHLLSLWMVQHRLAHPPCWVMVNHQLPH